MEHTVILSITDSAKILGLPTDSETVINAVLAGRLALIEGRGAEASIEIGRSMLLAARKPATAA